MMYEYKCFRVLVCRMTRQEILVGLDTDSYPPPSPSRAGSGLSTWSPADYIKLLNVNSAKVG